MILKSRAALELDSCDADAPSFRQPRLGYNFPAEKL
jgi:hypothetical protein